MNETTLTTNEYLDVGNLIKFGAGGGYVAMYKVVEVVHRHSPGEGTNVYKVKLEGLEQE